MQLEPPSTFNPAHLWREEKFSIEDAKENAEVGVSAKKVSGSKKNAGKSLAKDEMMKMVGSATKDAEKLLREIVQIRNSKSDLMSINDSIKIKKARAILLVQLLSQTFNEYNKLKTDQSSAAKVERNLALKKLVFELLWTLEGMGDIVLNSVAFYGAKLKEIVLESLPEEVVSDKKFIDEFMKNHWRDLKEYTAKDKTLELKGKDTTLVSDKREQVEKVLSSARALLEGEADLVRLQLMEMSDSLPPLSRFNMGYKLDPWQRQVLTWIDEGKSVVISAPTSSGKTILSGYVAMIFKTKSGADADKLKQLELDEQQMLDDENAVLPAFEENEAFEDEVNEPGAEVLEDLIAQDSANRVFFAREKHRLRMEGAVGTGQRVLFVVPTEPLVWQVAAYFTKLLKEEGDRTSRVGFVTEQISFNPKIGFNVMPQIVVGTPKILESVLSKPRGLTGELETHHLPSGNLPGGFDHFDWVIYDEVHSLDGEEGAALQRIIRSLNCPFLALSATIGNADELRQWFAQVREDQAANVAEVINVKTVEAIAHQVRFINLQRYVWDQSAEPSKRLQPVSPLAAINDAASLSSGVLRNSNLSFTSKDSYRVWEAASRLYPLEAIAEINPYNFFDRSERITLQRTKEYEDKLKDFLPNLAEKFPKETEELIAEFRIQDPSREFNLCELVLELKAKSMTPCLPFHLNTFEAIKLFQQTLAEIEWLQACVFPSYYTDRIQVQERSQKVNEKKEKDAGGNEKALQEMKMSGDLETAAAATVDVNEPHPMFMFSEKAPLLGEELKDLIHAMERFDTFEKRKMEAVFNARGENETILQHPLIRGLRRGIGLFVDEVSFPSYRRMVQRLASEGKLGVVISDGSLAFGVNMPFRTCVFCGEMKGTLDELMSQQMSGRAGRRGLDTQGNIIYAGIRVDLMRRLMIGKVSNITGELNPPKYEGLILQPILSPRHVGYARANVIAGDALDEYLAKLHQMNAADKTSSSALVVAAAASSTGMEYLKKSEAVMTDLGFIVPSSYKSNNTRKYRLIPNPLCKYTFAILAVMWELRAHPYESITIGMLFQRIIDEYQPIVRELQPDKKDENNAKMEPHIHSFYAALLQLVCRTAWRERPDLHRQPKKFSELSYFSFEQRREHLDHWAAIFKKQQESIPSQHSHLRDPVTPETELDATFFECCVDRHYVHTLDDKHKQEIKVALWQTGNIIKAMHDCSVVDDNYHKVTFFVFRNAFNKLKYLIAELVLGVIDFNNTADYALEKRADKTAVKATERGADAVMRSDLNPKQFADELRKLRLTALYMRCSPVLPFPFITVSLTVP